MLEKLRQLVVRSCVSSSDSAVVSIEVLVKLLSTNKLFNFISDDLHHALGRKEY